MRPETAVIIRTRNESRWIGETLKRLSEQTYTDFEIVIVDSGSTDDTLAIARTFPVLTIEIASDEFTYPHAVNLGIQAANATKYLVILSAHSLPTSKTWLQDGIDAFSQHTDVLGVYGATKALPDATFWDRLFHNGAYMLLKLWLWPRSFRVVQRSGMGVLGFTNAIIRRDLWERHHIDENYAGGGEDAAWADYWMRYGYVAIRELKFSVLHSHDLSLVAWVRQFLHWYEVAKPTPFKRLTFRQDGAHRLDTTKTKQHT